MAWRCHFKRMPLHVVSFLEDLLPAIPVGQRLRKRMPLTRSRRLGHSFHVVRQRGGSQLSSLLAPRLAGSHVNTAEHDGCADHRSQDHDKSCSDLRIHDHIMTAAQAAWIRPVPRTNGAPGGITALGGEGHTWGIRQLG